MNLGLAISHFRASTGGAEAYAVMIARRLAARGHRLLIMAEDGNALDDLELVRTSLAKAPDLAAARGVDLLIDWGLNVPADLHRLGGGVHREFQRIFLEAFPWPLRFVKGLLYRWLPRHRAHVAAERRLLLEPSAHFLAVSDFVRAQILRAAPVNPAHVHVLLNGVDTRRFRPAPEEARQDLRQALGLAAGDVAFLFVAHNLKLKNIALLNAVFPRVHRENPAAKLVILGRRDPGIRAPWALYVPGTDRPEAVYAAVDALVHPTYYDACANVVLEAMATGLPVVSSRRNGSAERIIEGVNGFVRPVTGPRQEVRRIWTALLVDLAREPETRRAVGSAARKTALAHGIDSYLDAFEELLERLLRERRADRAGAVG